MRIEPSIKRLANGLHVGILFQEWGMVLNYEKLAKVLIRTQVTYDPRDNYPETPM